MGAVDFDVSLNPHQDEYLNELAAKILHMSGGFGSGKTFGLVMKLFQLSFLNRGFAGGLMCPSFKDFKRDVLPMMQDLLSDARVKYHYAGLDHFIFPWSRAKLYIVSAEKSLRGPNWGWGGINELTLIPLQRYREFIGRVRLKHVPFAQIASCGTPEGIGSDYYDVMIEKPFHKNMKVVYGDTRDNLDNLSDDYVSNLEQSFDSIMLDAYLRGLYVNMKGNRFYYNYDPKRNDNPKIEPPGEHDDVHISLDFNVEYMTATCWKYDGHLHAFDQVVIENNADTGKMADIFLDRGYEPHRTIIYPDPAGKARKTTGKSDVKVLQDKGFYRIKVKSRAPEMRTRQLNTNNLLEKGWVKINPLVCQAIKKDFIAVTQDSATLEKDKSNKKLTHASDGFDVMTDILFPFSGRKQKSSVIKIR